MAAARDLPEVDAVASREQIVLLQQVRRERLRRRRRQTLLRTLTRL